MRSVQNSKNVVSIDELESDALKVFHSLSEAAEPVVVTKDGKPAGVVMSPAAYEVLTERSRFIAAVKEGTADIAAGRVHSHESVKKQVQVELDALNAEK